MAKSSITPAIRNDRYKSARTRTAWTVDGRRLPSDRLGIADSDYDDPQQDK